MPGWCKEVCGKVLVGMWGGVWWYVVWGGVWWYVVWVGVWWYVVWGGRGGCYCTRLPQDATRYNPHVHNGHVNIYFQERKEFWGQLKPDFE